jgi:predicted amidohydrolase YtcJ
VFHGGDVVTVDAHFGRADGVAVKDGRIIGVGADADLRDLVGPSTEVINLRGRMMLPGFVDSHCHPLHTGQAQHFKLDLGPARSVRDIVELVRARAAVTPAGEWIEAALGWREGWLAEKRLPTRGELDEAAPDHPVYLPHLGYTVVVNSAALEAAGISGSTPDPSGGTIGRDAAGEPTGVLIGIPAFGPVEKVIPPPTRARLLDALRVICKQNAAWGKTSALDAGLYPEDLLVYQDLWERGELTVRTNVMFRPNTDLPLDDVLASIRAWGVRSGFGDEFLRLWGIKMFFDGGLEGALLREPYVGRPDYFGQIATPPEVIRGVARLAAELGWNVGVHACGGAAMDSLLDIYEEIDRDIPLRGRRFGLLHGFFPTPRNMEQCRRMGIVVAVQQTLLYNLAASFSEQWGRERVEIASPHRLWLDNQVVLAGGIDATPFPILTAIWSCVTRGTRECGVVGAEQALTREEAIRLYTGWSAFATKEENVKGSIQRGYLADLIVLDNDILQCPVDEIRDTQVLLTMVDGRIVHGSADDL